jgi:hypothetical protein
VRSILDKDASVKVIKVSTQRIFAISKNLTWRETDGVRLMYPPPFDDISFFKLIKQTVLDELAQGARTLDGDHTMDWVLFRDGVVVHMLTGERRRVMVRDDMLRMCRNPAPSDDLVAHGSLMDELWSSAAAFWDCANTHRVDACLMEAGEEEAEEFAPLRARVMLAYDACMATPDSFELLKVLTEQLAPRGVGTQGDRDSVLYIFRQIARGAARLPGFCESLGLFGKPSSGKDFMLDALDSLFGTDKDSPAGYVQALESTALCEQVGRGGLSVFESKLEGARFAKISEASERPLNTPVYKALTEGGQEIAARAGYECRRTSQVTVQNRTLLLITGNKEPGVPHYATPDDKDAVATRWNSIVYELSFKARVLNPAVERQGANKFKLRAPTGHYNAELWCHLVRARRSLTVEGALARWLTPQPPSVLRGKEMLRSQRTPEERVMERLQAITETRRSPAGPCAGWPDVMELLMHEIPEAMAAVMNVTKFLTKAGYKTSGAGHVRVKLDGRVQVNALTRGGLVLNLCRESLERLAAIRHDTDVTVVQMLRASV